jgi:uridine kinase
VAKKLSSPQAVVVAAQPRQSVQARFPNGETFEAPIGTRLEAFVRACSLDQPSPIVAALVNGQLRELTYALKADAEIVPITMATGDGKRIYQRSLSFLLVTAARELFPGVKIILDHVLPFNGFYCEVEGRDGFSPKELERLEKHMRTIAKADEPIGKRRVPLDEAKRLFERQGDEDKVHLLAYRPKNYMTIYTLRGTHDYFYGYMVPSTGYLRTFCLRHYPPGFVLQFPRRHAPQKLPPFRDSPRLASVFRQHADWLRLMDVQNVAALNRAIEGERIGQVVMVAEALHEQKVAEIARQISARRGKVRFVLIAGPSSSGKTTFSKRLSIQLLTYGLRPMAIALDDYFVERHLTPRTPSGDYDFESLQALDLGLLNKQLLLLLEGKPVRLPRFSFYTGQREWGDKVSIGPDHLILLEGIHGLNPHLLTAVPGQAIFRIYASALTQLNIDHHNRVSTSDTRLLRRIVRDARSRGYSAKETIQRWEAVRHGENESIFPYQEHANVMFNSALIYEMAVLKPFAEPLLRQVGPGCLEYIEAGRLLAFLEWFLPCSANWVPGNSLLREFIGGSVLEGLVL